MTKKVSANKNHKKRKLHKWIRILGIPITLFFYSAYTTAFIFTQILGKKTEVWGWELPGWLLLVPALFWVLGVPLLAGFSFFGSVGLLALFFLRLEQRRMKAEDIMRKKRSDDPPSVRPSVVRPAACPQGPS